MKSILYVGATLMIGASIYGFVDYNKTSHDKKFTEMYDDKETKPVILTQKENESEKVVVSESKLVSRVSKKVNSDLNKVKALKPVGDNERIKSKTVSEIENSDASVIVVEEKEPAQKIKKTKRKKISTKFFSRAPIREEIEYDEGLPEKTTEKTKSELKKL